MPYYWRKTYTFAPLMMKRRSSILMILLANMLILAHAVVPHHHHNKMFVAIVNVLDDEAQDLFNDEHGHEHHHDGDSDHHEGPAHHHDGDTEDCLMSEAEAARDGWLGHQVSLDDYAGKTVYLCFRHHSTEGQYLLRLDDVNVMKKGIGTGIANTTRTYSTKETVYNAAGQRSDAAVKGLNIIRRQCEDGSVKTFKVIR